MKYGHFNEIARKVRVINRHRKAVQKKDAEMVSKLLDAVGTPEFFRLMPAPIFNFAKTKKAQ